MESSASTPLLEDIKAPAGGYSGHEGQENSASNAEEVPSSGFLDHFIVKTFLDWGALLTFYILQSLIYFPYACLSAVGVGMIAVLVTFLQYTRHPKTHPAFKILDVGFVLTFATFAFVASRSASWNQLTLIFANALMNLSLATIVLTGVWLKEPFVKPFAISGGLPVWLADEPFILAILCDAALYWAKMMYAMAAVCLIAPLYLIFVVDLSSPHAEDNKVYTWLTYIFTYGAQYTLLAIAMGSSVPPDYTKWVNRSVAELREEYGRPLNRVIVSRTRSVPITVLRDDRVIDTLTAAEQEAEFSDEILGYTLAQAFVDDPITHTWRGFREIADVQERTLALQGVFTAFVTLYRRLNHCFVAPGGTAVCLSCIRETTKGDSEAATSESAMELHQTRQQMLSPARAMPPAEWYILGKQLKQFMGKGTPYMYISTLGCAPVGQGMGLGTAVFQAALDCADVKGLRCALETLTNKNKDMYVNRFGFEVQYTLTVKDCVDPWYVLVRPVQSETDVLHSQVYEV